MELENVNNKSTSAKTDVTLHKEEIIVEVI